MADHDSKSGKVNDGGGSQAVARVSPASRATAVAAVYPRSSLPTVFVQEGGMLLIVGRTCTPISVHASLLKEASPVLRAKITMAESGGATAPLEDGTTVLVLYDDDAAAFQILCSILHDDNKSINIDADGMQKLAVVASKYECIGHVFFATDYFFRQMKDAQDSVTLWKLLAAACLLGHSEWFQTFSNRVTQKHQGSFLSLVKQTGDEVLGLRLGLAMEEKRTRDRSLDPSRAKGVLCMDCFKKATATFTPNAFCKACTEFRAYAFGSSLGALPYSAAITAPATAPGATAADDVPVPSLWLTNGLFGARPATPAIGGSLFPPVPKADGPSQK
ncbi:Uncharacterized protein TPAR_02058 [Tolypocladium paradoxum]|uniref:BTB domain-containing protein n=1 Tax=Tolypocladium paradoxum TaxID=94208 RepID=A0A2S4L5K7_9HYPO|nr:Uncharacterized protein TPAR_02058 [Tolypocladium paradoxum]